eukprot:3829081-Pleurochrysis_carterae.AAC.1
MELGYKRPVLFERHAVGGGSSSSRVAHARVCTRTHADRREPTSDSGHALTWRGCMNRRRRYA